MSIISWQTPSNLPKLYHNEVHVWCASLCISAEVLSAFTAILAADEIARAERFKFKVDHDRFIAARGILRHILAYYLETKPQQIQFHYGEHGKPQLPQSKLIFNMSHAHELALYAVTWQHELGVDVEWMRAELASEDIARRFFSPMEYEQLLALPKEHRLEAFFNCWTRKEAFIKALGKGLAFPLHDFIVNLDSTTAKLVSVKGDSTATTAWNLYSVQPANNYVGAVAVKNKLSSLKLFRWQNIYR